MLCPNCETKTLVEQIREEKSIEVKGESFLIPVSLWKCLECKEEFEDPNHPIDELDLAYREYRAKHRMLQPEEIRQIREEIGLTQAELARLLGWSPATISRYENGALQESSHDNLLHSLQEPSSLLSLVERSLNFSNEKLKELKKIILEKIWKNPFLYTVQKLQLNEPDIFSGYTPFNIDKYIATGIRIIRLCPYQSVPKTKLNKLMFYADFLNFKRREKSITGSRYIHWPYGPCPEDFQQLLSQMELSHSINIEETMTKDGHAAEVITAIQYFSEDVLTTEEILIIDEVCKKLGAKNSKELTDLSHSEKGYTLTKPREAISYEYAKFLKLK